MKIDANRIAIVVNAWKMGGELNRDTQHYRHVSKYYVRKDYVKMAEEVREKLTFG